MLILNRSMKGQENKIFSKCQVCVKCVLLSGQNVSRDFYIVRALFEGAIEQRNLDFTSMRTGINNISTATSTSLKI